MSPAGSGIATRISEATVRAHVAGDVSGQVAVGTYINQVGSVHGDLILQQQRAPTVNPRPRPLDRPPSRFPDLLGRDPEVTAAIASLRAGRGTGFHGGRGAGKSSVLRHVANLPEARNLPDGVLFCPGRGQPLADLLQLIFDGFYDADLGFTPTPGQRSHYLSSLAALVVIDDLELADGEVGVLADTLPQCTLLLVSESRRAWAANRSALLRGLPEDAALALLERELERPLTSEERQAARALAVEVDGHPGRLVQVAGVVCDERRSVAEAAAAAATGHLEEWLAGETFGGLTPLEREVLGLIAAVEPAPLHVDRVAAITGLVGSAAALEELRAKGLVQAHSPRYSLTVTLPAGEQARREGWAELALDHYLTALEADRAAPDRFADDIEPIRALATWAVGKERWRDVIRLVRAADPVVAMARRWEARSQLIRQALTAARSIHDTATVAWCYHQLGTRALWMGDEETAWFRLSRALELRQSLGDQAGADLTQFHLDHLAPPPGGDPPSNRTDPPPTSGGERRSRAMVVGAACLVVLVGTALLLARDGEVAEPLTVVPLGTTAVEVRPSILSFNPTPVGTRSAPRTVTLTVKGPGAMTARGASVGDGDYAIVTNGCTGEVDVGSSCRIAVRFTPSSTGDRSAALTVHTDAGDFEVALVGNGTVESATTATNETTTGETSTSVPGTVTQPPPTAAGRLQADRSDVSFGDVEVGSTSPPARIALRSTGSAPVAITSIKATGATGTEFKVSDTCRAQPLEPSRTCDVSVAFSPTTPGPRRADLVIAGEGLPPLAVGLSGNGVAPRPRLHIDPAEVRFPATAVEEDPETRVITVTNTGTATATIISVTEVDASEAFDYQSDCLGSDLAPKASCSIVVWFTPPHEASFSGTLSVSSKEGRSVNAILSGKGTAPTTTSTTKTTTVG